MRINRADLLQSLEAVQPGLSAKGIIEQSNCFVFLNGCVHTYNDEVACRAKSPLGPEFKGAVQAGSLVKMLSKFEEEEIDIDEGESELVVSGKRDDFAVRMEKDVSLPVSKIEVPADELWKPLHEDFTSAISIVQECAGSDESLFILTCVNIHPKFVEAFDNDQMARFRVKTGVTSPTLVKREALKHITSLDMTEVAETQNWIHFRNSTLALSCRRYVEQFPDLSPYLEVSGEKTVFPKGIMEACDKAEIFSQENQDKMILVELRPGKLRIKSIGVSGWYRGRKKLDYTGRPLSFRISPKLLTELTKKHNECEITQDRLKVESGKFRYVTCLGRVEDEGNGKPATETDTSEDS